MKKLTIILVSAIAVPMMTVACDICGCGVGNTYIGILPEFHKHIFGIRYRYNSIWTHLGIGGNATYLTTRESYNVAEAWGGWNIGKKFRVMASVPYSFNKKTNQGITNEKNGLGDIAVSGYYQLLNSRTSIDKNKLLVQSLWIGRGMKLATGAYNASDKSSTNNSANLFQLGTGSYDFNIGAMYDIRLQDAGINVATNYKMTTANKYQYRYGNKFNVNAQAYYKIRVKNKWTLAPNVGVQYENARRDIDNMFNVMVSGGNLLLGTAGIEMAAGKFSTGANFQTPLSQNLAHDIVKANNRVMLHVAMAL